MNNKNLDIVRMQLSDSANVKRLLSEDENTIKTIAEVAEVCTQAYRRNNKILFAGNGGSAADAQHLTGELVNKFYFDRPGLPAIALTTDTSVMTAIGNDYGFDIVFARQIQAQAVKGDVFIGISTSGNSENIVKALDICREKGVITVALTGSKPCKMDEFDYVIKAPSDETPRIQECQTLIGHILCCLIEKNIFGSK